VETDAYHLANQQLPREPSPLPAPVAGRSGGEPMSTDAVGSTRDAVRSKAGNGIVSELRLQHPELLASPTLRRARDLTVDLEYRTTLEDGSTLAYLSVRGDTFSEFESALEVDGTVAEPLLVERYADRRVYRVTLTDRAVTCSPKVAELGGRVLECSSRHGEWVLSLRLPDRDALVAFNDYCGQRNVTVQVNHLRVASEEGGAVVGLTEKQQQLLTVAYQEGYFEVPRGISQRELADRLDVSKSAISQQLRRAVAALCTGTLADGTA